MTRIRALCTNVPCLALANALTPPASAGEIQVVFTTIEDHPTTPVPDTVTLELVP